MPAEDAARVPSRKTSCGAIAEWGAASATRLPLVGSSSIRCFAHPPKSASETPPHFRPAADPARSDPRRGRCEAQHRPHLRRRSRLEGRRLPGQRFHGDAEHRPAGQAKGMVFTDALRRGGQLRAEPGVPALRARTRRGIMSMPWAARIAGRRRSSGWCRFPTRAGWRRRTSRSPTRSKAAGYATGIFGKWHLAGKDGAATRRAGFRCGLSIRSAGWKERTSKPDNPEGHLLAHASGRRVHGDKPGPAVLRLSAALRHSHGHCRRGQRRWRSSRPRRRASSTTTPLYAACTYDLDDGVGILLTKLKELGLEENTLRGLHQRQRRHAAVVAGAAARQQGLLLRRRHSRAVHRALARRRQARQRRATCR